MAMKHGRGHGPDPREGKSAEWVAGYNAAEADYDGRWEARRDLAQQVEVAEKVLSGSLGALPASTIDLAKAAIALALGAQPQFDPADRNTA